MPKNAVGWFDIYVQNLDRAKVFYETVLAVELQQLESPGVEMWSFPMDMQGSGAPGALVKKAGVSSGGNSTVVYFNSEDCAIEAGRVAQAGGRIHNEKFSIGQYGFIAVATDTEGNMFGIHSMK
jgi:predicted enzyme related to lactoylglutathione lyase